MVYTELVTTTRSRIPFIRLLTRFSNGHEILKTRSSIGKFTVEYRMVTMSTRLLVSVYRSTTSILLVKG